MHKSLPKVKVNIRFIQFFDHRSNNLLVNSNIAWSCRFWARVLTAKSCVLFEGFQTSHSPLMYRIPHTLLFSYHFTSILQIPESEQGNRRMRLGIFNFAQVSKNIPLLEEYCQACRRMWHRGAIKLNPDRSLRPLIETNTISLREEMSFY